MSPVAIEVADRPDIGGTVSGTWYGLQYMSQQEGGDEGYIVQAAQVVGGGLDILSTTAPDELEMTIDDLNTVIGTEYTPLVLTQRKDPPWGSTNFDDMVAYVREHPGEVEYICLAPGSGRDIAWASYAAELELEFKEPWVCGDGSDGIAAIIGAGEGDLALNTPGAALIGVESDRMDVIFQAGTVPAETGPWVGVPTGADVLGEQDPWGFLGGWAVTGAVSELHRQWLYELFRVAGETDELQELRQALPGTVIVSLDHDESTQVLLDALEQAKPILQELEMCVGAQCS
jgi:tripartite-type tricarboxylate transporter receptor subunit TctC